jgi:hypothetical protein
MIALVLAVITYCRAFFVGRQRRDLEIASLRQQLVVFKRKRPPASPMRSGSSILGRPSPFVAGVGDCPGHRKARYRDCLASCWVSPVLAMAIVA